MALPLPDLDTRRWADLTEEARTLIPRLAPGWTDHNAHDPGITLIELIAWLVEQDIYRVNRVPERHRRKFLRLLGFSPVPPTPARTVLSFVHSGGAQNLPEGTVLTPTSRPDLPFRTLAPLVVHATALTTVQAFDGSAFTDHTRRWQASSPLSPWGSDPIASGANLDQSPALYLGFDQSLPVGEPISLWLAFDGAGAGRAERARLTPGAPHHSVRTRWEYSDGAAWHELTAEANQVTDDTRGLTLDGSVVLTLPGPSGAVLAGGTSAHYLRCRLDAGQPDEAPALRAIAVHAVEAEQAQSYVDIPVGTGGGTPGERVVLPGGQIAYTILDLRTFEANTVASWEQRPDLGASGRRDRHVVLDATTGELRFGDGERGRVAPAGADILATYHVTAGAAGNLGPGLGWQPSSGGISDRATNVVPAGGGGAEEDLEHLAGRAAEVLWAHERLVELAETSRSDTLDQVDRAYVLALAAPERATSLLDFERLALDVPGTRIARARAWAGIDPAHPGLTAPGTVTVAVVPHLPAGRPEPTAGLLAAVRAHLDARRTITTRLLVVGPSYLGVRVRATVAVLPGVDPARVLRELDDAVNGFLDPVRGGPRRLGWPFGRDVYRAEVLEVLAGVSGVDHVRDLQLIAGDDEGSCGNLCVPQTWLVTPGHHEIEIG
jgi:hypothetical protein